jgi:hypothetical protein
MGHHPPEELRIHGSRGNPTKQASRETASRLPASHPLSGAPEDRRLRRGGRPVQIRRDPIASARLWAQEDLNLRPLPRQGRRRLAKPQVDGSRRGNRRSGASIEFPHVHRAPSSAASLSTFRQRGTDPIEPPGWRAVLTGRASPRPSPHLLDSTAPCQTQIASRRKLILIGRPPRAASVLWRCRGVMIGSSRFTVSVNPGRRQGKLGRRQAPTGFCRDG